jgi:tetratricopeptide (TPR) repeat protein
MGIKSGEKKLNTVNSPAEPRVKIPETEGIFNKPFIHILAILFSTFLIYSNTFNAPFLFDDLPNITENPAIKDLYNFWPPSGTRWFGSLTFAINYRLGGMAPFGFHIVNLAIHILNAFLVYWLVLLTLKTPYVMSVNKTHEDSQHLAALFSSLLFLSHPIQTQAVTYIVQRFASLATLFYLMSLVMYIKWKESKGQQGNPYTPHAVLYAVSLLSAILAMKTKEIAFTLPMVMVIYEFMFFQGKIKRRVLYLVPFVLTMLIVPLTLTGAGGSLTEIKGIDEAAANLSETQDISRLDYLYTQFRVIVTYLRLLFLPINQNLDYDYPIYSTFFNPEVFISFISLLLVFVVGIYLHRLSEKSEEKDRYWLRLMSFGIFWFFVTLSVESSIIPIRDVIYEHRVYLPSVGFFVALTSGIRLFSKRWGRRRAYAEKTVMYVMLLAVIMTAAATYARNSVWGERVTLWADVTKKSPNKARTRYNLGNEYSKLGYIDEAINEYIAALKIKPDYADAHYNLGASFAYIGRIDEAIIEFQEVLKLNPKDTEVRKNLEILLQDKAMRR